MISWLQTTRYTAPLALVPSQSQRSTRPPPTVITSLSARSRSKAAEYTCCALNRRHLIFWDTAILAEYHFQTPCQKCTASCTSMRRSHLHAKQLGRYCDIINTRNTHKAVQIEPRRGGGGVKTRERERERDQRNAITSSHMYLSEQIYDDLHAREEVDKFRDRETRDMRGGRRVRHAIY